MKRDTILILDFGAQYCHLIGRRIRENSVYTEILCCDFSPDEITELKEKNKIRGVILSGGPSTVTNKDAPPLSHSILDLNVPILGLCYGHQLLAKTLGGVVQQSKKKEYGPTLVTIDRASGVLTGLESKEIVWMSHGDKVYKLPPRFEVLAHTENSRIAAFRDSSNQLHGLQWHPEVSHTEKGDLMLKNFIFTICGCKANWDVCNFEEKAIIEMKREVKNEKCILALSGGVDSSTAAVLASKAIGKNLTAVFVDHGFMRIGEPEFIRETLRDFDLRLLMLDERERFLRSLRGVIDPEEKRKIIGREFIRIFEKVAKETGASYLIQGTIYPDTIESGSRRGSETIKTHHNVGGLPPRIAFKAIIEPLGELYKDEVRKIGESLGLPEKIVWRQPFPGPGLAVRIIGEVTPEKLSIIKKADKIMTEAVEKERLERKLWQYFPVLTQTMSTGVKGDRRAYGYTVAIRAVESRDGMTANLAHIPYAVLERISARMTNEIPEITRVVYDVTSKPPATIEWE